MVTGKLVPQQLMTMLLMMVLLLLLLPEWEEVYLFSN